MNSSGVLIVLEGSDGSGKTTQFNLLKERLKAAGYDVEVFDFPRYDKDSSHFIKQYLNGNYGPAADISPYTASLFYALDRFEAAKDIRAALKDGKIVLINRYVGSNMAHQGSKFADPVEQRGFFVWEDNLEYQLLDIPRPDTSIFLRVPAATSYKLISHKNKGNYTANDRDEHEADLEHLKKSVATYDLLCQLFPKDFQAIDCTREGKLLSVPEISNLIWAMLAPLLPQDKPHAGRSTVVSLSSEAFKAADEIGAADDKLVQKFKAASLLLKLNIERQIKSVDPAGFSVWSDYDYEFYTPRGLPKAVETQYKLSMERIAELHRQMRQQLEKYYERNLVNGLGAPNIAALLMPATPLSALCSFSATLSQRSVQRVAGVLLANDSEELQWAAKQLYLSAKGRWPQDFKNPLESAGSPEPINNIIAQLAEDKLSLNSADKKEVRLLEAAPRQEFDLLAESIYPYSSLSLDEIGEEVSNWSYVQKYDSLKQAAADKTVLDKIHYKFDLITDQALMNELVNTSMLRNIQAQVPSPRFGYEVPPAVEAADIDDLYLECFDESLKLFSILQQADRDDLTVYSTLLGHKLRWQFSADAKNLKTLFEHQSDEYYGRIAGTMRELVAEAHPLTWEVLNNPLQALPETKAKKNRVKPSKRRRGSQRNRTPRSNSQ